MNKIKVEVVCAERLQGLVETFGDAVVVGVPSVRSDQPRVAKPEKNKTTYSLLVRKISSLGTPDSLTP